MNNKRFLLETPAVKEKYITAYRDFTHPKGEKFLFSIPNGDPLPKGIIIGKGCHLLIEEVLIPLNFPDMED